VKARNGMATATGKKEPRKTERQPLVGPPLLIGVSARIHHPADNPVNVGGVYTKTLHYLEQSVAHWVIAKDVLAVMIPAIESEGRSSAAT
jgi:hypothetical protein